MKSEGEICEVCSDDLTKFNEESCYCITHYTEVDSKQCVKCPENCYNCGYDSQTKNLKCLSCDEGFTLNSKGICVSCGENCDFCQLDINGNPICLTCHGSFKLNEDKNCLACDSHCVSCINGKDNTKECTKCEDKYGLYTKIRHVLNVLEIVKIAFGMRKKMNLDVPFVYLKLNWEKMINVFRVKRLMK